jgi:hypothetical protein
MSFVMNWNTKFRIMKTFVKFTLLTLILFGFSEQSYSQETNDSTKNELKLITKHDGTQYVGTVLKDDGREVLIDTKELGKIYIPKSDIKSIKTISEADVADVVDAASGIYDPAGPITTRYYFTNNALPTKKGDSYAMIHLYGPEVHFGLGKGFSMGVMTTWGASPFILAMKQSTKTKNEKLNFSLGTMFGSSGYFNQFRGWGGMHWGTMTYGSRKTNFSVSGGFLYIQPGFKSFFGSSVNKLDEGVYTYDEYNTALSSTSGYTSPLYSTPIFSIAGIAKIRKKVSFFYDTMISVRNKTWKSSTSAPGPDTDGSGTIEFDEYLYTVAEQKEPEVWFMLMPGLRIQGSDNNAFQIALAGITYIRGGNTVAFPIPQCSWFFKI